MPTLALRVLLAGAMVSPAALASPIDYPEAARGDRVDLLHGVEVADPYRWLEDSESPAVTAWVAAQNRLTARWFEAIPEREAIRARITALRDYAKVAPPLKAGGRYYYLKNDGIQDHYVLWGADSLDAEPRVVLDPNGWSQDGSLTLDGWEISPDGRYVAYGVVEAGSDWRSWRVQEIASGRLLDDRLDGLRYTPPAWAPDGRGLYYARYATEEDSPHRLFFHPLGTPQTEDRLVFTPAEAGWVLAPSVTADGRWLVLTVLRGSERRYRIHCRSLTEPEAPWTALVADFRNEYTLVSNDGSTLFFVTDLEAPRRRIVALDASRTGVASLREIVPESSDALVEASRVGNRLVVQYLRDARTAVRVFSLEGRSLGEVELPGLGSAFGFQGRPGEPETFYYFSSFGTPASVYRYDVATGETTVWSHAATDFDPADYTVEQVFFAGADGTRVPMFLAHRRGLARDGSHRTLLYGYGAFGSSLGPTFSASRLAWLEMGGVFALAGVRGGGEYGEAWHRAGSGLAKSQGIDDFIAAGEWLVANGYTRPAKLAIQGRSGGGLLVAAAAARRPDLFAACLMEHGISDMLRYPLFGAGRFWIDEFGSPDDPAAFRALIDYSPYHRVRKGVRYPATLVVTAEGDERVAPWHSYKFAAALQWAQAGPGPILLRVDSRAGHGVGTPTERRIRMEADLWAFLTETLHDDPGGD